MTDEPQWDIIVFARPAQDLTLNGEVLKPRLRQTDEVDMDAVRAYYGDRLLDLSGGTREASKEPDLPDSQNGNEETAS